MATDENPAVLCFRLRGRWFGLDAATTLEVVSGQTLMPVPGTPGYIPGVLNRHGRAIAVMDLAQFLDLPAGDPEDEVDEEIGGGRILVVRGSDMTVGILADKVHEVVELDDREMQDLSGSQEGRLADFSLGVVQAGDLLVTVMDPLKLIRAARI